MTGSRIISLVCFLASLAATAAEQTPSQSQPAIEPKWFEGGNGVFSQTETIELKNKTADTLLIRYCPIADSGVELELLRKGIVVWRVHVQPLGVEHSKYRHTVLVSIDEIDASKLLVVSVGAKTIHEIRSLQDGREIGRIVTKTKK